MKAFAALKSELVGILHNRKLLTAIIGVMTIPLLYSGTFLWAFWNPYGHLGRLPIAVVNNDQGASYNGHTLEIGNELVKKLKDKKSFNWKFVSEERANQGIKNQDYYIKIEIPKNFSQNATTLQSSHPEKLNLIYTPNEGYNYLSSKIGDSAIEKMKGEISSAVTKTYAESMFNNLKDVANGLNKASDGASQLNKGIDAATSGTGDLKEGIVSAQSGAADLSNGVKIVDSGTKKIEENLTILTEKSVEFSNGIHSASKGSQQLQQGLEQFGAGLGKLKKGNSDLLTGTEQSKYGAKQLSDGLNAAMAKMPELQNGSKQLADGTTQLSASLDEWTKGAQNTKDGAVSLSEGLQQIVDQMNQLANSTNDPAEKAKLEYLNESLQQLSLGSQKVAGGISQLSSDASLMRQASDRLSVGSAQLNQGQGQLTGGLNQLAFGAKQLSEGQDQLTVGLTVYGNKLDDAMNGFSQLTDGSSILSSGLNQLAVGSVQLGDGTNQLAEGSKQLAVGTGQLSAGTNTLKNGMSQLADGSSNLESGMNKLAAGSKELSDQLKNGANDASDVKANDNVYEMVAKPINLKDVRLNHVPDYGTGFTPYFLSLSLFVGALVLSVIFPMVTPAGEPKSGFSWFAGKVGILLLVGIAQALLADMVLLQGLGLEVKSVPFFIMLSIFTSWTFLAIIQFLVSALDNPGRFLGIIILILQLTSSAGTYPIELVPKMLQKITYFLPMTYSIAGFRAIVSTGDYSYMWRNIGYISIFFVAFLMATYTFFTVKFNRQKVA